MSWRLSTVPPEDIGSAAWLEERDAYEKVAHRRGEAQPEAWAEAYLHHDRDREDLRALGFCLDCGVRIVLRQFGKVVSSVPCGHVRIHGDLKRITKRLDDRRAKMPADRVASVLELIGGEP